MRKAHLILTFQFFCFVSFAQPVCITLQPDGAAGRDAVISSFFPAGSFPDYTELDAIAWTSGGNPANLRGLIKFDLSSIPSNAVITSARISLYAVTTTPLNGNLVDPMFGTNAAYLQRITADWSPTTVTWNNQPATTSSNQVTLATSTSTTQNYTNVDVTALIQDMRSTNNYGFLLRQITETPFRSMTFASSNHPNAAIRPKLEICYTIPSSSCIVLQPDGAAGRDAVVSSFFPNGSFPDYTELDAIAWTSGGNPANLRGLIKFDLSSIPSNAVITSAKISLYAVTTAPLNGNLVDPMFGTNAAYLQRITADWSPTTVTWNNQPATTSSNQVTLATSTSTTQNYTNVDVTALIQDMRSTNNYGFLLRQITETPFRSMTFASSNHPNAAIRPKLEICYTIPSSSCIVLQPDGAAGRDAVISSFFPAGSFPDYTELDAIAWTSGGNPANLRGLVKFDLSSIPSNAVITSAKISLYAVTTAPLNGNLVDPMFGTNAAYLQRITVDWSPTTVTWNNQPATTSSNQVTLATSTSTTQNYTDVDVTALIQDMRSTNNYGFLLRQINETPFRSMTFASSNHPNAAIRPKLEVCYNVVASTGSNNRNSFKTSVWPNPVQSNTIQLNVELQRPGAVTVQVIDITGKLVSGSLTFNGVAGKNLFPVTTGLQPGVYLLKISAGKEVQTQKIIVQ